MSTKVCIVIQFTVTDYASYPHVQTYKHHLDQPRGLHTLLQWVPWTLSLGYRGWGLNLTTGPHLVVRLRIGGAVPFISPYAIIAWTGVAVPLALYQPKL